MTDERLNACVLVVDDVPDNLNLVKQALEGIGCEVMVATSGERALETVQRQAPELILLDVMMPGMDGFEVCRSLRRNETTRAIPVIFLTGLETTDDIVEGFRAGGIDYIVKPFRREEVQARVRTQLERVQLLREVVAKNAELEEQARQLEKQARQLTEKNRALQEQIERGDRLTSERDALADRLDHLLEAERQGVAGFIGRSPAVQAVLTEIELLRQSPTVSVLVTGESGTGKEGIARAIHFDGSRAQGPFVAVNCAAIPSGLAESSFFGHLRGAFTGAHDAHQGYFEQADSGTLFLDEIGDLPLELQAKLLRVIETGQVTPLGGKQEQQVDVRIVAATNRDLSGLIAQDRFREDLYFRLAGFTLVLPPLRQRREDIALLVDHFLRQFSEEMGRQAPGMSREALNALEAHEFPGNVRELKNLVEFALIRSQGGLIRPEHLRFIELSGGGTKEDEQRTEGASCHPALDEDQSSGDEERILAYVRERGSISNTECRTLLAVDQHRASYLLKRLHAEGVLEKHGERRWTRYGLPSAVS